MAPAASKTDGRSRRPPTRRVGRVAAVAAGALVLLLFAVQFAGSAIATRLANRRLADLPEFGGRVGRVHVVPWGARVVVRDFLLWQRGQEGAGPIVAAPRTELDLAFLPLFAGRIRGEIRIVDPAITLRREGIAAAPEKEEKDEAAEKAERDRRLGEMRRWQQVMRDSFPMELSRFEVSGGTVRVEDRAAQPPSTVELTGLKVVLTDLRTKPAGDRRRPSTGRLEALVAGSGRLQVTVEADPAADTPEFGAKLQMEGLALTGLRDFLHSAAKVDVTAGTFDVYIEVDATGGAYEGYVKPFLKDVEFEPVKDPNEPAVKRLVAQTADAVTDLLKNEEEKVATRAPFQGNFADNRVDVWTTIENLLRNAFVQSLREGLEARPRGK